MGITLTTVDFMLVLYTIQEPLRSREIWSDKPVRHNTVLSTVDQRILNR